MADGDTGILVAPKDAAALAAALERLLADADARKAMGKRAREGNTMMAECYFCKGRVVQEKVNVDFRWGRKLKVIENVPAGVCQQCGEKYFHAAVYKVMEKLAVSRAKPVARLTVDVVQFKEVA